MACAGIVCRENVCILAAATQILFAVEGQGILSYEMGTSTISTVVSNDKNLMGIGYDWINNKIYYCRLSVYLLLEAEIYRSNIDGTEIETLETNVKCEFNYWQSTAPVKYMI